MNSKHIPDYRTYEMKLQELILTLIVAMGACFVIGLIFYENIIISLVLSFAGVFYIPVHKKELLRKRKDILRLQFKDALYFISVSLSAGKSLEMAVFDAFQSLRGMYPEDNTDIMVELNIIKQRLLMNEPIEKCFLDLAQRSDIEEIRSFADVIIIAKRSGANLVEVIRTTSVTISEKVEIQQEIVTMIAGKKLEHRVLCIMPFVLVFFLKTSSPGFLDPLIHTPIGNIIMTIALLMIAAGILLGKKIMRIEV